VDVPTAAAALGLSRNSAYELIRCGGWPTPVFRLGRLIRIPTAPLLELLGLGPPEPANGKEAAWSSTSR
jgi:predicted DNA-binding transcriptional regulator AlpA